MAERLLNTAELADYLGVTAETVRNYRESLGLPCLRIGRAVIRYDLGEVRRWLAERNRGLVLHLDTGSLVAPPELIEAMTAGKQTNRKE